MFKSFEHFKSTVKTAYDALRSDPSMKLAAFKQIVSSELGYNNPQSIKNFFDSTTSKEPKVFYADQIGDFFNDVMVMNDHAALIEFVVNQNDAYIVGVDTDAGVEEHCFPIDDARAELYDGVLSIFSEDDLVDSYTVYERHKQPEVIASQAHLIYVDGICDLALYINGKQVCVADTAAGDDRAMVVDITKSLMDALSCELNVVHVSYNSGEDWNWDDVWHDVSSNQDPAKVKLVDVIASSQDPRL